MLIPFENLSSESRLWVYVAERTLTDSETEKITSTLENFLKTWQAHGQDLEAGVTVRENRLILIGVNENVAMASGCSIDTSVAQLRELEKGLSINLLEQGKTVFRDMESQQLKTLPIGKLKKAINEGKLQQETSILNTWATRKGDWQKASEQKAKQTWLKRYFK